MTFPSVVISVLNRNRRDDLIACLRSILGNSYRDFRVILVDNSSRDGSVEAVKRWASGQPEVGSTARGGDRRFQPVSWEEFRFDSQGTARLVDTSAPGKCPGVAFLTIISSTENLGFAGGHNLAIGMALQSDTPYVLMLNSDIVVDSDFLAPLVAEVEPSDTCAAGPVVLCGEGRDTIWQAGGSINLATGGTRRNRAGEPLEVLGGETRTVSYLPGCAVLLKARALRDVGNLDSAYFLYYEDTDWFARAGRLGWKAVLVPQSKVWHKETPLSTQAKSLYSSYYFARNRLQFVRRNRPACLAVALIWSLRYGVLNNAARRRWLELGMSLRGIRDFLRGKRGRCEAATPQDVSLPNFLVFSVDYKPQPGGIAEHSHRVALGLRRAGTGVVVLASSFKGWREFDRNQPFHTYRVPRVKFLDLILHLFVGLYVIIKHRVGVIYVATSNPCAALCFLMRQVVSFKCGVTIHAHEVLYGRTTSRQKLKLLLRPLQIAMISRADRVFAVSEFTRQLLIKAGVASAKIFKIYNGVDLEELDGTMDTGPVLDRFGLRGKRIILTVARLDIHKGQDVVIKALPSIIAEVPGAVYVVVGEGVMRPRLVALSETLGVSDRVVLAGGLPRPEVIALFKACDVFAMTSRIERGSVEGFGIVFLEAGALGKPVVGGRLGGIPDAVEDGLTGLLVDPTSPEEVAGAISRILLDHDLAARFGAAGSRRARSLFTWEKTIERILDGLNAPVT